MPEGPEIHLAARFVNDVGRRYEFGGAIVKSEVSTKNPNIVWNTSKFSVRAEARGKEMKLVLESGGRKNSILFRFGMSGSFQLSPANDLPKHAHLRIFTVGVAPRMALCFVDYRRFGRWFVEEDWSEDRGPDPMFEYDDFRQNVLQNLHKSAFNRPICEALLNQKFFNGIGNYLRAEILYRAGVRPFDEARKVLEDLINDGESNCGQDLLELCCSVPREVMALNCGMTFNKKDKEAFTGWLQCYNVREMNNLVDSNNRTIWFSGPPGPLLPKNSKNTKSLKLQVYKDEPAELEGDRSHLNNDFLNIEPSLKASEVKKSKSSDSTKLINVPNTTDNKRKRSATPDAFLLSSEYKTNVKTEAHQKKNCLRKDALSGTEVKSMAGSCSSRSRCHLCGNIFQKRHKKKKCSCNKMVHKGCYEDDGCSCESHMS